MTPRSRGRLCRTFLLVWLATGCHYGGGDHREAEEQAPERLVITTVPGSGPQWHVEPDPEWILGDPDADGPALHRVDQVLTLSDGSILVSDASQAHLLRYDPGGRYLGRLGGMGFGPGEFRTIAGILPVERDRILVFDPAALRVTTLSNVGAAVATVQIALPEVLGTAFATYRMVGRAGPERIVLAPAGAVARASPVPRLFEERHSLLELDPSTGGTEPLPMEWVLEMWSDELTSMTRPFGQRTLVGARGHSLYIGDPRTGVIEAWEGSGSPITLIEVRRAPTEVSPSIRASWLESRTARITDPAARREEQRRLEAVPFPEALPAFDALLAGPEGEIWLRDPMVPGESEPPRWSVIDAAGTVKAWATLPAAFRPMEIHDGHLLGVWTDALGVQTVRRFRLARR